MLFNVTGGTDLTMAEVDAAAQIIAQAADPDANIIFGATIDENLTDSMKITVIATGFDETRSRLIDVRAKPKEEEKPTATEEVQVPPHTDRPSPTNRQFPEPNKDQDDFDIPAFMRQDR